MLKEVAEKETEIQKAEASLIKTQQELEKYQKSTKELLAELRDQYVDLMQEQAAVGNELKYLERQYVQETAKSKQTLAKQSEVEASVDRLILQKEELTQKQAQLKSSLTETKEKLEMIQQNGKKFQEVLAKEQPKMYQLMNQVQQLRARQKSLQEIQENYFGFYQGVRLVLQHKQQLSGIVGAVAELIDVPADFTLAIETALGGAAQHVIVENEKDARQAITYLKQQRGGRATFLPLTTIKPRQLPAHILTQAAAIEGFIGIASEQVAYPDQIQTVVQNLLGTILLTKDLTSANAIAQTIRYQYRVVSNYFGFYQGVRLVLQHKQQLSGIVGAVAELIDVPADFTLAIETALGGAAQHVIVENEKDARQAITYLKQQRGGRATFLPLTTIKPRQLPAHILTQAAAIEGFIGIASEQVAYPDQIQTVVQNLLGTILLAKDLTSANAIAQTIRYQYRVVSLEGDVMNAGGSMTGGANKRGNQGSLFVQNQELKQLTSEFEEADKQLQVQEKKVQELQQETARLAEEQEVLRTRGEQLRFEEQEATNQLQNIINELERFEKEKQISTFETRELQQFIEDYEKQTNELKDKQTDLETQRQQIDEEIKSLSQESDQMEARRAQVQSQKAQEQADLAVLKEQFNHLQIQLRGARVQIDCY